MSYIEYYHSRGERHQREMWDKFDISEYCNISIEKAYKLHLLANKHCGVTGYGDINKEDFLDFLKLVKASMESQRLQDEANASTILYNQKSFRLSKFTFLIDQAISLLSNH